MELKYTPRKEVGSRSSKRLRQQGMIPAVIYGKGKHIANISIDYKDFNATVKNVGKNALVTLICSDQSYTAIIKEVDYDLVKDKVKHISFQQVTQSEKLQLAIPLVLTGEFYSHNGIIEQQLSSILVECRASKIPRNITFDTSNLNIGDSINVKDIATPEDIVVLTAPNIVVGSIVRPHIIVDDTEQADKQLSELYG